jgi:hypothetical protein
MGGDRVLMLAPVPTNEDQQGTIVKAWILKARDTRDAHEGLPTNAGTGINPPN